MIAIALLGSSACSRDTPATEGGETTHHGSTDESTTIIDETDSESTATDTNDTLDDESDPSTSFYAGPEADWGGIPVCDPFVQDCPEGEKCVPYDELGGAWSENKCVPVLGTGQPGDPCTYGGTESSTDDCDATSFCWDTVEVEGELVGTCVAFCGGTADDPQCADGTACVIANDGSINLCLATCDPLAPDCPEGLGCHWANTAYVCTLTSGDGSEGQACSLTSCSPGHVCVAGQPIPGCAGDSCCATLCSLTEPTCPTPGTECTAFFDEGEAPEGYEDVGICVE